MICANDCMGSVKNAATPSTATKVPIPMPPLVTRNPAVRMTAASTAIMVSAPMPSSRPDRVPVAIPAVAALRESVRYRPSAQRSPPSDLSTPMPCMRSEALRPAAPIASCCAVERAVIARLGSETATRDSGTPIATTSPVSGSATKRYTAATSSPSSAALPRPMWKKTSAVTSASAEARDSTSPGALSLRDSVVSAASATSTRIAWDSSSRTFWNARAPNR